MLQRKFVISCFIWSKLCLQKDADYARIKMLYLRCGRLLCWTTTYLKETFSLLQSADNPLSESEVHDFRKSQESGKEKWSV